MKNKIQLFEEKKVRTAWDDATEDWYFSIVDVVDVLTESPNPRKYWSVLKTRLKKEGSELTTNCSQLKMVATDGKKYLTDVVSTQQLFRLIQSIPYFLVLIQKSKQKIKCFESTTLSNIKTSFYCFRLKVLFKTATASL